MVLFEESLTTNSRPNSTKWGSMFGFLEKEHSRLCRDLRQTYGTGTGGTVSKARLDGSSFLA
jgi:hypothetical protein